MTLARHLRNLSMALESPFPFLRVVVPPLLDVLLIPHTDPELSLDSHSVSLDFELGLLSELLYE